jgi:hypothetical protein
MSDENKINDESEAPATSETPELTEQDLEQTSGGLLLPAIQKVREAANRSSSSLTEQTRQSSIVQDL